MNYRDESRNHIFECDECGEQHDSGEDDFFEALKQYKEDGWIVFKDDFGAWQHRCPVHKGKGSL